MEHIYSEKRGRFYTRLSPEERFWKFVKKTQSCWLWTGVKNDRGYGQIQGKIAVGMVYAHRFSYEFVNGKIPKGNFICHSCDNPPCVNPDHLFIGTPQDNVKDMIKKKRNLFGDKCPWAKINESQVRWMIENRDKFSMDYFASKFKVTRHNIYLILTGRSWKHIN